jgi:hypothetical protein
LKKYIDDHWESPFARRAADGKRRISSWPRGPILRGVGGGFDLLPRTVELIHDGFLDFTIDQQPYVQGFYTVLEAFVFVASGGLVGPANINTGLKFVTGSVV